MKIIKLYPLLLLFFFGCGTRKDGSAPNLFSDTSTYFHVYEYPNHQIKLNGNLISPNELDKRLSHLAVKGGIVNYSCGSTTEELPSNSKVIDLLKKYRLPIKLFADSNFTKPLY